ncbi:hypothetical protein BSKO_07203 [Bryopsis sp. KO-2023]|nr:hypothetical protein BSKO_07203 [Bryopsis sp. KO-2023]
MAIPAQAAPRGARRDDVGVADLNRRFSRAIINYNAELSGSKSGSLVQVWQPEIDCSGVVMLVTQGLPFSISGVGDLLALFRCISCKYRFSTDGSKPETMGAVGRAFAECQVEMCSDVQKHGKSTFLRVDEAQRCSVHSTVVLPVFMSENPGKPVAVIEISHHEKDVQFATIISRMDECLKEENLSTMDVGNIDGLLGDGIGVRYQIYGPGRALVTAANAFTAVEAGNAVLERTEMPPSPSVSAGYDSGSLGVLGDLEPRTMGTSRNPVVVSMPEVNGLVPTMVVNSAPMVHAESVQAMAPPHPTPLISPQPPPVNADPSNQYRPDIEVKGLDTEMDCKEEDWGEGTNEGFCGGDAQAEMEGTSVLLGSVSSEISADSGGLDGVDSSTSTKKHDNRLGGGAGKRLTYKDLQAQFAVGLKEAATRLGICPTTLKRACRRNGISRWPSRQIAKLNKAWSQMGYSGSPPEWLVKNAIAGNLKADNLAFALNTGLHMGLLQNLGTSSTAVACPPPTDMQMVEQKSPRLSPVSCPSSVGAMSSDDTAMMSLPTSASMLSVSHMEEGFLSDMRTMSDPSTSGNRTWHAGQNAASLLPASGFRSLGQGIPGSTSPQTMLVPMISAPANMDFIQSALNDFECPPTTADLEGTQRGHNDLTPMLAGFDGLGDLSNLLGDP